MTKFAGPTGVDKAKVVSEVVACVESLWDEAPENEFAADSGDHMC